MARPVPAEFKGQTLTDNQLVGWARSAGIPSGEVSTAVAIALAESGGRVDAVGGPNFNGSYDYGVWQINESAHPDLFAKYPEWWSISNAKMMAEVSGNGTNWKPWSVYNSGAYRLYMQRATVAALGTGGVGTVESDSPNAKTNDVYPWTPAIEALQSIGGIIYKAGAWTGDADNWVRVAQVVAGVALVVAGVAIVVRPAVTATAGAVAKAVR